MDVKTKILEFLKTSESPKPTLIIAKAVGFKTKKDVNPFLYSLEKDGTVKKFFNSSTSDNGSCPCWYSTS
jgi:hypothetical protein